MNIVGQCPWDGYEPATIRFCEDALCSWITKPAETWSNIGFVIVGIFVLTLTKKENNQHLRPIGYIGISLGICSGIFHATGTFFGEFFDVGSMLLFTSVGVAFNLQRLLKFPQPKIKWAFLALLAPSLAMMLIYKPTGIPVFGVMFASGALIEWRLKVLHPETKYKYFAYMAGTFLTAFVVWWLDILKIWCNPNNHYFNGHAFWHLMTALTFYQLYRFYAQFDQLRPNKSTGPDLDK